ncbi:phosphopantetheinyl transferase (holo-ACP synthase) [Kitasatospora sp. MAP12-15]|uniref:hypothetical protein n=1 Tax=unclassified Kitasatospora TaxID=2633591 RepID=UPI0024739DDE|nr:hypothetical protein [Kitasatospora sp. MAP12-44]MDH6111053.1 phosphopantetheinyl transferase (holo-ACP synthase) [Kitasatospora sp. MAP12-44]
MPEPGRTVLRVGAYSVGSAMLERLLRHHPQRVRALFRDWDGDLAGLPIDRLARLWAVRQAAFRALAAPPRIAGRWTEIEVRCPGDGPCTLLFHGEVARYAAQVLRGDVQLSVTTTGGITTAFALLTRTATPPDAPTEEPT